MEESTTHIGVFQQWMLKTEEYKAPHTSHDGSPTINYQKGPIVPGITPGLYTLIEKKK